MVLYIQHVNYNNKLIIFNLLDGRRIIVNSYNTLRRFPRCGLSYVIPLEKICIKLTCTAPFSYTLEAFMNRF